LVTGYQLLPARGLPDLQWFEVGAATADLVKLFARLTVAGYAPVAVWLVLGYGFFSGSAVRFFGWFPLQFCWFTFPGCSCPRVVLVCSAVTCGFRAAGLLVAGSGLGSWYTEFRVAGSGFLVLRFCTAVHCPLQFGSACEVGYGLVYCSLLLHWIPAVLVLGLLPLGYEFLVWWVCGLFAVLVTVVLVVV
jgi:hypothetical protein